MNDLTSKQATISEEKMQIVINNYFKSECSIDTSIHQAFEKGFRIGVKKGLTVQSERPKGEWILITDNNGQHFTCSRCGTWRYHQGQAFCSHCGADMRKPMTTPKEIIDGVLGYDD